MIVIFCKGCRSIKLIHRYPGFNSVASNNRPGPASPPAYDGKLTVTVLEPALEFVCGCLSVCLLLLCCVEKCPPIDIHIPIEIHFPCVVLGWALSLLSEAPNRTVLSLPT